MHIKNKIIIVIPPLEVCVARLKPIIKGSVDGDHLEIKPLEKRSEIRFGVAVKQLCRVPDKIFAEFNRK